jgi:hypothetical protein
MIRRGEFFLEPEILRNDYGVSVDCFQDCLSAFGVKLGFSAVMVVLIGVSAAKKFLRAGTPEALGFSEKYTKGEYAFGCQRMDGGKKSF